MKFWILLWKMTILLLKTRSLYDLYVSGIIELQLLVWFRNGASVFEAPLKLHASELVSEVNSLPTDKENVGDSFSVVLRPWLQLRNLSGLNLQCSTWTGPILEGHDWTGSSVALSDGSVTMPPPGAVSPFLKMSNPMSLILCCALWFHKCDWLLFDKDRFASQLLCLVRGGHQPLANLLWSI